MKKFFTVCLFLFCTIKAFGVNLYPINDSNSGGYIDKNGNIKIKQQFSFAYRFKDNFAIVEKNNKFGVINSKGRVVVGFKYDELKNLSENFVIYRLGDKFGIIDILKNKEYPAIFYDIKPFNEGLAAVLVKDENNLKWGFINKKSEIVIEPKYFSVGDFSEGLASYSFEYHKTAGYLNKKGKSVLKFEDNALDNKNFSNGLVPIIKTGENACSYINKKGKIVINSKTIAPYKIYCGSFKNGVTVFYNDEKEDEIITGFIDKKGKIKYSKTFKVPKIYSKGEFSVFNDFSYGMAQMNLDYKTGYIDKNFKLKIPIMFEFGRDFEGDLAYIKFEDREGYINKQGRWVWYKNREGM